MALDRIFQKAAATCFKVFKSMVIECTYTVMIDNEFYVPPVIDPENPPVVIPDPVVDVLVLSTAYIDVTKLSFFHLIQPEDKIGLVKGVGIPSNFKTGGRLTSVTGDVVYSIESMDVDPAKAIFTLLLRG